MKIVICTDDLVVVNGYTLVPRYLAKELIKHGCEVKVLCVAPPKNFFDDENPETYVSFPISTFVINKSLIHKTLSEFNPDIIHTNGIGIVDRVAIDYAKQNNKKVIATLHTRIKPLLKEIIPFSILVPSPVLSIIQRIALVVFNRADLVIALSPEMREYLYSIGLKNVEILSNGVDLNKFKIVKKNIEGKMEFNILYVGNIEKRKNQIFLLKMAHYLPANVKLHLVGGESWDKTYYNEFLKELKALPAEDSKKVIYHGKVPPTEVKDIYAEADLFVSASLMEAQSLVLLESLVMGLPIVRLVGKSNQGVTYHLENSIHLPEDVSAEVFANAVVKLLSSPSLYNELSQNALKERDALSWSNIAKKYIRMVNFNFEIE